MQRHQECMFVRAVFYNAKRGANPLWSKAIAWWTNGDYSHVELWFDGDADKAKCFSSEEGQGVRFITRDLREHFDVVNISDKPIDGIIVYEQAAPLTGKKYDWLGLLGFMYVGPLKLHDVNNRFCSEVCFEVLEKAKLFYAFGEQRWKVSPNELATLLSVKFGTPQPISPLKS